MSIRKTKKANDLGTPSSSKPFIGVQAKLANSKPENAKEVVDTPKDKEVTHDKGLDSDVPFISPKARSVQLKPTEDGEETKAQKKPLVESIQKKGKPPKIQLSPDPDPEKIDDSKWKSSDDEYHLAFWGDDKYYIIPARGIVYEVPTVDASGKPVYGVPAVSAAGNRVVMTGKGQAVGFDAGSGKGSGSKKMTYAIYQAQIEALRAKMGIKRMAYLFIIHHHMDHIKHIVEKVKKHSIPASRLIIPDFFLYKPELRQKLVELAKKDSKVDSRGYQNYTGSPMMTEGKRDGALIRKVNFKHGSIVFDFYANEAAIEKLKSKTGDGKKPASKLEDSASFMVRASKVGSAFRMMILGDLRGADYEKFAQAMNKEEPGSFERLFFGVKVIGGFQHHLGTVNSMADVKGIQRLLNATIYQNGTLSVVVQNNNGEQAKKMKRILRMMGIDVGTSKIGGTTGSGLTVDARGVLSSYGPDAKVEKGLEKGKEFNRRFIEIKQYNTVFNSIVEFTPTEMLLKQGLTPKRIAEIRLELKEAMAKIEMLQGERNKLFEQTSKKTTTDAQAKRYIETHKKIMEPLKIDKTVVRNREVFSSASHWLQLAHSVNEIEAEMKRMGSKKLVSPRFIQLMETVSPSYFKMLKKVDPGISMRQMIAQAQRQAQLVRMVNGPSTPAGPGGKAANIFFLALTIYTDVIKPIQDSSAAVTGAKMKQAVEIVSWWEGKTVFPKIHGVVDNFWTGGDEYFHDRSKVISKLQDNELQGLYFDELDEARWNGFANWVAVNLNNYDDFYYFVYDDPAKAIRVSGGGDYFEQKNWEYQVPYWSPGTMDDSLEFKWVHDERLTAIMQEAAGRVIKGTKNELDMFWEEREEWSGPRHSMKAVGSRSKFLDNLNARRKVKIIDGMYKGVPLYGLEHPKNKDMEVIVEGSKWYNDPHFYEIDGFAPKGYVRVIGADYNTFARIRSSKHFVSNTREVVYIRKRYYERGDVLPTYPDKELKNRYMNDPNAVWNPGGYSDSYDGYFSFPDRVSNSSGVGLLPESFVITDTENKIE